MITRAWVQDEIERALEGQRTRENVYDLSALITVLGYLDKRSAAPDVAAPVSHNAEKETDDEKAKREAVVLTRYSADLDTRPTLEQIYEAMDNVGAPTVEDRKKLRDAKTWADIIKGDN